MNPIETLSLVLGTGFSSGLNLYATIATLGLLERFGVIHLPEKLRVLSHPIVLGVALGLYLVEFLADKVPYIDSVWQAVHTFIRPPAAALLAFSVTGSVIPCNVRSPMMVAVSLPVLMILVEVKVAFGNFALSNH